MTRLSRLSLWACALPIAVALILTLSLSGAPAASAAAGEAPTAAPSLGCSLVSGVRVCELWVVTGTLTLPGPNSAPIWGYSTSGAVGSAELPGPTLEAVSGETMQIVLHNTLPFTTSLTFLGQAYKPDYVGIAQGGTLTYTFVVSKPGTFAYMPGLTPSANRQMAMGMYGALIVRPASNPGWAYDDAATAFDNEALLVISELDPDFNADPLGFPIQHFDGQYWLINGQPYPLAESIVITPAQTTLLRYVNLGSESYSLELLGLHQSIIAKSGAKLPYAFSVVADNVSSGDTMDTLVAVPAGTATGSKFPLFHGGVALHNKGQANGGMMTFLEVQGALPAPGLPTTEDVTALPSPTSDTSPVAVTAVITSVKAGSAPILGAEFFIDSLGTDGTGTAMTATDGTFDEPTEQVDGVIAPAVLGTLANGPHIVYVHGRTAGGWGVVSSIAFTLDRFGPDGYDAVLVKPQSNGSKSVDARATVLDEAGLATVAAEYFIDAPGANGTGTAMAITPPGAHLASIDATIPAVDIAALSQGAHLIYMHAQDSLGNWGQYVTGTLKVDKTGPTGSVSAVPNPTDGKNGVNATQFVLRVTSFLNDPVAAGVNSSVARAELFINPPITHTCGDTGYRFMSRDVLFDEPSEVGYVDVPLGDVRWFADGAHTLKVCALDAAGNWGQFTSTFSVDKTGPTVSSVAASPNPAVFNSTLTAIATDPWSVVTAAEYFIGADPGVGLATPMTGAFGTLSVNVSAALNSSTWAPGSYSLCVRARDALGNWTTTPVCTTLTIDRIFADGFESGNFSAWSSVSGTTVQVTTTSALQGVYGLRGTLTGTQSGYVQDNSPANETTYRARFYFHPNGTTTGGGAYTIFNAVNTAGTAVLRVQAGTSTPTVQRMRLQVLTAGGTTGSYFATTNAAQYVEVLWQSGTNATVQIWVNGVLRQTLTNQNTSAYTIDAVRLGPQYSGSSVSGQISLDSFASSRGTLIGP